ncbi:ComEA family DNA-binding protein [Microvirga sesbaniae]|uniref:ComEA family DNA-binding protein n=1 Tax=Microvirga sesbaniae TaxID=681392 RepID=UPI0021C8BB7A|nr:helix-hairpin-helix domain-containing protein [Microvirga sp. HBU67692]
MQVGDLSRTQTPQEPRDNAALQAMRILLVIGLMSAGWLALWRFQAGSPAAEGMVSVAPPETVIVETRPAAPADRAEPLQVADADASVPAALPVKRPAIVSPPDPDEDDPESFLAEPVIDSASLGASRDQSLAVLKQFEAIIGQSSKTGATKTGAAKPPADAPADMNMTGTVTQQASRTASYVPAGESASALVDLNKGSVEQLNTLRGAGSLGRAIVRGRPYKSVEDLVTKRVVRRTAFERIKDQVTVQ